MERSEISGIGVASKNAALKEGVGLRQGDEQLFFWRTRTGVEVDFVMYGPDVFWAIEVKNGARVRPEDLRGLEAFGSDYPEAQLMLLYRGTTRERTDRIWILPVQEFLRGLDPTADRPPWETAARAE